MLAEPILSALGTIKNMDLNASPSTLIPEVYQGFRKELLNMLESLETGEKYKSPFFSQEVDPFSQAMPIVMNQTFSIYDQMITHLYKSLEVEKKWMDMLGNIQ